MSCSLVKDIRQLQGLKKLLYVLEWKGSQYEWRGMGEQCVHRKIQKGS